MTIRSFSHSREQDKDVYQSKEGRVQSSTQKALKQLVIFLQRLSTCPLIFPSVPPFLQDTRMTTLGSPLVVWKVYIRP